MLAARHEALVAQIRREEAEVRAEVQADLAGALASVDELRQALDDAREQHRELVAQHRTQQQERERAEAARPRC